MIATSFLKSSLKQEEEGNRIQLNSSEVPQPNRKGMYQGLVIKFLCGELLDGHRLAMKLSLEHRPKGPRTQRCPWILDKLWIDFPAL